MSEIKEVQEQMKADMEAMKEQMMTMMEAMMDMRKIMEFNDLTLLLPVLLLRGTQLTRPFLIKKVT